jgi:chloride channel 3/4/5
MSSLDLESATERTHLLNAAADRAIPRLSTLDRRPADIPRGSTASSIISSLWSRKEQELAGSAIGERLPYNDYTTIDWLHDLVSVS